LNRAEQAMLAVGPVAARRMVLGHAYLEGLMNRVCGDGIEVLLNATPMFASTLKFREGPGGFPIAA
jgi:hypothetical protein